MRYLIIEFEPLLDNKLLSNTCVQVRELLEKDNRVTFLGNYPDKASAQCCSIIREVLING